VKGGRLMDFALWGCGKLFVVKLNHLDEYMGMISKIYVRRKIAPKSG